MAANQKDPLAQIDAFFRRNGVPENDVADLRQDAYSRMAAYVKTHEDAEPSIKLLQEIAGSVLIDYRRERGKRARLQEHPDLALEEASPLDLDKEYNDIEILDVVLEIVSTGDERTQSLFKMLLADGDTLANAAKHLQIPESTATGLRDRMLRKIRDEMRRRGITRALPLDVIQVNGAASERHGVSLDALPPEAPLYSRIARPTASHLFAAAIGALILFLFLGHVPSLANLLYRQMYFVLGAGGAPPSQPSQDSAPTPTQTDAKAASCPPVEACPPSSPSSPSSPPSSGSGPMPNEEKSDATNRLLFQTVRRAENAGDCETVRQLRPKLTGSFAAAFAKHSRCNRTP